MNKVILMGRLTRDAETRYAQDGKAISKFTLAVDRKYGDDKADFISCVAFGKVGEFAEKYAGQGVKFVVEGRIQTGSYTNSEGRKCYSTDVVVESMEFAESKKSTVTEKKTEEKDNDGFMSIPDGMAEELPWG